MEKMITKTHFKNVPDFQDLREMLYRTINRYPDEPAFMFKENIKAPIQSVTYRHFADDMEALGSYLVDQGLQEAYISVIGENSYPWSLAHLTIVCGVGVSVPLDRLLPEGEVLELLLRCKPAAIFYGNEFHETMIRISEKAPSLRLFVNLDGAIDATEEEHNGAKFTSLARAIASGKEVLAKGDTRYTEVPIDREKMCCLLYTSGTTALAKGVMLSHRNFCVQVSGLARVVHWKLGIRSLSILPLHHTFENTCGLLMILFYGGTICQCNGLRYIQQNMVEYKIQLIIGVPLIFESFYKKIQNAIKKGGKTEKVAKGIKITRTLRKLHIDVRRKIFKEILAAFGGAFYQGICGAAPIDPEIIQFFDDIGVQVLQGYGMTETAPVIAGCNHRVFVVGSVGHPIADTEVAIDNQVPGEEGEILVRGGIVMQGYLNDDGTVDRSSIDEDGWLHTGDVGRLGEKGCLFITGRVKSMIVLPNGKKVFPEEVEYLINRSGLVADSMVWGEGEGGDVFVSAKFVLNPEEFLDEQGQQLEPQNIKERLDKLVSDVNAAMPNFKMIKYYVYSFEDMVRTTTRKIKRNVEQENIRTALQEHAARIKDWSGRNIDEFKKITNRDLNDSDSTKHSS